jgi:glyoxylase-like metal-dependent hydrolase (beta-lactamase superfamily II)
VRDSGSSEGRASRREVLRGLASGIAGLCVAPLASSVALAAGGIAVADVGPKLKVLTGAGGNIVVLATSAGQVVVDSGAAAASDAVVGTLRELGGEGGKVAVLVNTHWHRDQTGANERLGEAGATIVAHAKTRQRLSAGWYVPSLDRYEPPLPSAARPTRVFYTTDETTVGGERVELGYLIEAHTDGDAYVRLPAANVIAAGDALSPQLDPVLDWFGGGWLGGRVDALAKLLALGDARTRYVPSFGPVVGRAEVQAEHDFLKTIFDRMVVNLRLGQTADDMLKAGLLDGLPRTLEDPAKFLYDAHKGFWAHHNKLMNDIV